MAAVSDHDGLDEEIRELLLNYHFRRETSSLFCTKGNIKECLIDLLKELESLNIDNVFDPYCELEGQTLRPEALVKLINSFWALLQLHKTTAEKTAYLVKDNNALQIVNKRVSSAVDKLKEELKKDRNQLHKCFNTIEQAMTNSDDLAHKLDVSLLELKKITKEKDIIRKTLLMEISRIKTENEKLMEKQRHRIGSFTACSEICQATISQLKQLEGQQLATITKLQHNTTKILKELLDLKIKSHLSGTK